MNILVRKAIRLSFGFIFVTTQVLVAQTISVTGTVKDVKGIPIPSASLQVKRTNTGVSSDTAGFFTLRVEPNAVLLVSAVGFEDTSKTAIRSLNLNNGAETIILERLDLVNPQVFLRLLTRKDNGYSLYKSTKTKLIKANYTTNGIVESGNPYDEYMDEDQYYILSATEKGFKTCNLWPKSIKTALKGSEKKVNAYFYNHAGENIDELFVKGLIEEINR